MVTLLGLFEEDKIFVKHRFLREGDAVDSGELLALFVAAPVGAGDGGQLDGLDDLGVAKVRSAAEVGEMTVGVVGDGAVGKFADELALVFVTGFLEVLESVRLGHVLADEVLLLAGQLKHSLLDLGEISVCDLAAAQIHVIVESVLDGRSDAELDTWEYVLKGLRHQV